MKKVILMVFSMISVCAYAGTENLPIMHLYDEQCQAIDGGNLNICIKNGTSHDLRYFMILSTYLYENGEMMQSNLNLARVDPAMYTVISGHTDKLKKAKIASAYYTVTAGMAALPGCFAELKPGTVTNPVLTLKEKDQAYYCENS